MRSEVCKNSGQQGPGFSKEQLDFAFVPLRVLQRKEGPDILSLVIDAKGWLKVM